MNVLDLFSGIGGFSLGLERAGFKTVAFCEIDKKCQLVLKKHWPDVPIFDDVKTLKKGDLNERIDVICGGFPCQDISLAGKGAGLAGERSGLWREFHRLIKEIKPKFVIIENVAALRSRGLDEILGSLASIGYDAGWHCIPASAVGAPHRRDRIWIVAYPHSKSSVQACQNAISQSRQGDAWMGFARGSWGQHVSESYTYVADTTSERLKGVRSVGIEESPAYVRPQILVRGSFRKSKYWEAEPSMGRVADGVPNRVDRLKQLGNAIVPQIAELIGKAIIVKSNVFYRRRSL